LVDDVGALQHVVARGADDLQADAGEGRDERGRAVAPEPDDARAGRLKRVEHLRVAVFERDGVGQELFERRVVRPARRPHLLPQSGGEHAHAFVVGGGVAVFALGPPPAEARVDADHPVGGQRAVLDHLRQAADVILVRVRHDDERDVKRRLLPKELPQLRGDRGVAVLPILVAGVRAVDEDGLLAELAEHGVPVLVGAYVEQGDPERLSRVGRVVRGAGARQRVARLPPRLSGVSGGHGFLLPKVWLCARAVTENGGGLCGAERGPGDSRSSEGVAAQVPRAGSERAEDYRRPPRLSTAFLRRRGDQSSARRTTHLR
jgi:hypothetical protein